LEQATAGTSPTGCKLPRRATSGSSAMGGWSVSDCEWGPAVWSIRERGGGGDRANWLQATTTRYKCLISHAGLINLESQWGASDVIYHREVGMGGPVWEQGQVWREQNPIPLAER